MIVEKTGSRSAQVSIKSGMGIVTLGDITNGGNFNFTQVVAAIALGNVDYDGGVNSAADLQAQIVNSLSDAAFNSIILSQLVGQTINFGTGYTVTFIQRRDAHFYKWAFPRFSTSGGVNSPPEAPMFSFS